MTTFSIPQTFRLSEVLEDHLTADQFNSMRESEKDQFTYDATVEGDECAVKILPMDGHSLIDALNVLQEVTLITESRILIDCWKRLYEYSLKVADSREAQEQALSHFHDPLCG